VWENITPATAGIHDEPDEYRLILRGPTLMEFPTSLILRCEG
jgi:hypothetical protein